MSRHIVVMKLPINQMPIAADFWIIWIVSMEECSSLMQNLMQIHCCTHCHFECDSHTVHMLTQWCLPLTLTRTVKLSLSTHVHSSPLSLAARLHRCGANCSHYIDHGWILGGQTLYISPLICYKCLLEPNLRSYSAEKYLCIHIMS